MLLMRLSRLKGCTMGGAEANARRVASSSHSLTQFLKHGRRKMFGTLTLIKRNGSEGSTMTMDSRETTIGR